ncbi:MAG: hypothetical protein R3A78_12475 [Polyangiales bacterium]|nr:hypothetical protein [Myxococcales bacterium]
MRSILACAAGAFVVGAVVGILGVVPGHVVRADGASPKQPSCITTSSEARFSGYAYDHIVHIQNDCDAQATCDVSTSVDPTPRQTTVAAHSKSDVVVRRGSPSREFSANVQCRTDGQSSPNKSR